MQLFFILSGYLICISLERTDSVREFYKKRIRRIVPEYYAALILYWFIDLGLYAKDKGIAYALMGWDALLGIRYVLRYFTFFQMILPSENSGLWNNRHAWWTMSSFMVFYLLAPFFFKYLKGFFRSFMVLFILLAGTPIVRTFLAELLFPYYPSTEAAIEVYCESMPLTQLYCFFLGIVLYWALKEGKEMLYVVFLVLLFLLLMAEHIRLRLY